MWVGVRVRVRVRVRVSTIARCLAASIRSPQLESAAILCPQVDDRSLHLQRHPGGRGVEDSQRDSLLPLYSA